MRVSAELKGRRLLLALLLLALLPALLAVSAFASQRPEGTPGPPSYDPLPLARTPVLAALQVRELQRSRRISRAAAVRGGSFLAPPVFPETLPTLVLGAREAAYTLPELRAGFPSAFGEVDGGLLLRASLQVPAGAHLVVDAAQTPDVRLTSSPAGFATLVATRGRLSLQGAAEPLRVSSWDPERAAVDTELGDGRAFVLALGGRLDVDRADVGHLGFGTGTSSGMAWRGEPEAPGVPGAKAVGDVTGSTLHHNWFGAYAFEAQGMRWADNVFADNAAYGFDPHDLSNDFVVERNVARGNGRHGFIFSRGCDRNVLQDNLAVDNRGHGFMIDDGRSEDSEVSGTARALASNDNQLLRNRALDNDGSGIELEGGVGLVVQDNEVRRNHVGIRVKNAAAGVLRDNRAIDNRLAGIDVLTGAGDLLVQDNVLRGGWAGVTLADPAGTRLVGNDIAETSTPLAVAGVSQREDTLATRISRFYKWNPVLVLWTAILGVPVLMGLFRAGAWVRAQQRQRRRRWSTA